MIINCPTPDLIPSMKALWSEAFGETEEDVDHFFNTAFSPERSRVAYENGEVLAALYVLDFSCKGKNSAYIMRLTLTNISEKEDTNLPF